MRTLEINEDLEDVATPLDLEISLGAGELFISKTSGEMLTGTIDTNFDALKRSLSRLDNEISIHQTENISGILSIRKLVNKWDL